MRVKLSYTVEEEDVLYEAAKLLNLGAEDLQQTIGLFTSVQEELKGGSAEEKVAPNVSQVLEMIEEFRKALMNVDIRLAELADIISGYDDYQRAKLTNSASHLAQPPEEVNPVALEEEPHRGDSFGSD